MRKILSLLLVVVMIASVAVAAINAADVDAAADGAGKATVTVHGFNNESSDTKTYSVGETFTVYTAMDMSRIDAQGKISAIHAQQGFDTSVLQLAEELTDNNEAIANLNTVMPILVKGSGLASATTPGVIKYNASAASYDSPMRFTGKDSMLLVIRYKVVAPGNVDITTSIRSLNLTDFNMTPVVYKYEVVNSDFDVFVSLSDPAPSQGSTVKGTVTSFGFRMEGDVTDDVTVQLLQDETVVKETVINGNTASYAFDDVEDGDYVLRVSKAYHVPRDYDIKVAGEEVTQDAKIHLLGDVNGDGKLTTRDYSRAFSHITDTKEITDPYEFKCVDICGKLDGEIKTRDASAILSHITGSNKVLFPELEEED